MLKSSSLRFFQKVWEDEGWMDGGNNRAKKRVEELVPGCRAGIEAGRKTKEAVVVWFSIECGFCLILFVGDASRAFPLLLPG